MEFSESGPGVARCTRGQSPKRSRRVDEPGRGVKRNVLALRGGRGPGKEGRARRRTGRGRGREAWRGDKPGKGLQPAGAARLAGMGRYIAAPPRAASAPDLPPCCAFRAPPLPRPPELAPARPPAYAHAHARAPPHARSTGPGEWKANATRGAGGKEAGETRGELPGNARGRGDGRVTVGKEY